MLHSSSACAGVMNVGARPTKAPVTSVLPAGVRKRGCTRPNTGGSRPSRDMTMKMRACPSWNTSSTAVTATTAPNAMNVASWSSPARLQRHHQRIARAQLRRRHHAGHHRGGGHVQHGADDQRADDPPGQVALGIAGLLGGGADGVEADVAEERQRGPGPDAGEPVGGEGHVVGRLDEEHAHADEHQHQQDLEPHQHGVGAGALPDAQHQHGGHRRGDQQRRQVEGHHEVAQVGGGGGDRRRAGRRSADRWPSRRESRRRMCPAGTPGSSRPSSGRRRCCRRRIRRSGPSR